MTPWQTSSVTDSYYIAPSRTGSGFGYLVFTSSPRAWRGCEAVLQYGGGSEAHFAAHDWSVYHESVGNPYAKQINLPTANPQYLTQRADQFGVYRQMLRVRNGCYYLGPENGLFKFRNKIELFDFVRGEWDVFYSRDYYAQTEAEAASWRGTTSPNSLYTSGMVETFDFYADKMTEVLGCDQSRMFYDGEPIWQNTQNTSADLAPVGGTNQMGSDYWRTLSLANNTHYTVALTTSTHQVTDAPPMGTLCVTANTSAAGFTLSSTSGIMDSYWANTPDGQWWDKTVVGLPPGYYSIAFEPVAGMSTPSGQIFEITQNGVTTVKAVYGDNMTAPPIVMLTAPLDRQTLWGSTLSASAIAAAGTPPYTVKFFTKTGAGAYSQIGIDNSAPYAVSLSSLPIGTHQIYAQVTDSSTPVAQTAVSEVKTIFVSPTNTWGTSATSANWSAPLSWVGGVVPSNGASVIFGSGGGSSVIDTTSRTVSSITFNRAADFSLNASGGAGLTINGGGITVSRAQTYTLNVPVTLGEANTWNINTGTLRVSSPINSSASLTKNGSGQLVLSVANSISGGVTHNAGALQLGNSSALGSGVFTINGGSLSATVGTVTISSPSSIVLDGSFSVNGFDLGTKPITLNKPITATVTGDLIMGNAVTGPGGLNALDIVFKNTVGSTYGVTLGAPITLRGNQTVSGSGSVFSGAIGDGGLGYGLNVAVTDVWGGWGGKIDLNAANTYSGDTTVSSGRVNIKNNLALQNSALNTAAGIAGITVTSPTVGGLKGGVDLASVFTSGYSAVTSLTLNPLSGTCNYSGVIANGANGMILNKSGNGTQVLSGTISSTGAININNGTLMLDGSHTGGGAVTVKSGARLGGNGSTNAVVTVQSGGKLVVNISDWGAGTCSNLTSLILGLPASWSLDVSATGFTETSKVFPFFSTMGGVTGFTAPTVSGPGAGTWQVRQKPTDAKILELVYTPASGTATTLNLVSSLNPAELGQSVTFTATVKTGASTATAATGSCLFKVNGVLVATVPISAGVASYSTDSLTIADHAIQAIYTGAAGYATSSANLTQTIVPIPEPPPTQIIPTYSTRADGFTVARFNNVGSGVWTVPDGVTSVEVMVVGGGGGGGSYVGGGGGAGGLVYQDSFSVIPNTSVNVAVGAGGYGGMDNLAAYQGLNGEDSVFGSLTALGGGGGGGKTGGQSLVKLGGRNGGSGGGGLTVAIAGTAQQPTSASGGLGNSGFSGSSYGGGGGAGAASTDANGGSGFQHLISGSPAWYAAGGGAAGGNGGSGIGGSGRGGWGVPATDGLPNTGSGGGGANGSSGGRGGSGVILVSYVINNTTTHTVNFVSNGGSSVPNQTVVSNSKAMPPITPTRSGYLFAGWCSDIGLTTFFNFNNAITANTTLYAKWGASYLWTPTAAGTAYNWNNASAQNNWTSGFPNNTGEIANLNINFSGAQTISLNQAITVGLLNIGDTGNTYYPTTIAANGGSLIMDVFADRATISKTTSANNVTDAIAADILLNDDVLVHNAATSGMLTISGIISGSGRSLEKTGAGTLRLSKANTYSGDTTITAGTLQLGNGSADGNGSVAGNVINNATLHFNNADALSFVSDISGSGSLIKSASGAVTLGGGSYSMGNLTIGNTVAGGTIALGNGSSFTIGNGTDNNFTIGLTNGDGILDGSVAAEFTANVGNFWVGYNGGSPSTVSLGASSNITALNSFYVGYDTGSASPSRGTITVASGGTSTIHTPLMVVGGNQKVATGQFNLLGTNARLNLSGIGDERASLIIGQNIATSGTIARAVSGSMDLSTGIANLKLSKLVVGEQTGTTGPYTGNGTLLLSSNPTNHLDISGPGTVVTLGYNKGSVSSLITNGTLTIGNLNEDSEITSTDNSTAILIGYEEVAAAVTNGTLNLNGGALKITTTGTAIAGGGGNSTLNLDGGASLVAGASSTDWINGLTKAEIKSGGATIHTNGFDLGISQAFSGVGELTKEGTGVLTLSGANTYAGATNVIAGTLLIDGTNSNASGVVNVSGNASFGGNGSMPAAVSVQAGGKLFVDVFDWADENGANHLQVGSLTLNSAWVLDIASSSNFASFSEVDKVFPIFTATGNLNGFNPANITIAFDDSFMGLGEWSVRANGNTIELVYTAGSVSRTTLNLISSLNPAEAGENVTFTATVKTGRFIATTASGTCAFKVNGSTVATVPVSGGIATYSANNLERGAYAIEAVYSGSETHDPSSASLSQICGNRIVPTYTTRGDGKIVATFTSGDGFWAVPGDVTAVELLVIGGGGGGGSYIGGGGGAGGLIYQASKSVTPNAELEIRVGSGGAGGVNDLGANQGGNGGSSEFASMVALGGGGGGAVNSVLGVTLAGLNGGSGGGGANGGVAGLGLQPSSASPGAGSNGFGGSAHGGGGGAGAAASGASGGAGLHYLIDGELTWYAGGGAGAGGAGGSSIGGHSNDGWLSNGSSGVENTGSGGGGGNGGNGGNGGAGVVILAYANSALMTHTVAFNVNGGSTIDDQTVVNGYAAIEPTNPTKFGHVFGGWYANTELTIPYNFSALITADATIHAKWVPVWTVTFDSSGGTAVPSQVVIDGANAVQPENPIHPSSSVMVWCSDSSLTNVYNFNTPITANITLYAKWGGSYSWTPTAAGSAYNWDNVSSQNNWTSGFPNGLGDTANLTKLLAGAQTISLNREITVGTLNIGVAGNTAVGLTYTINANGGSLIMDVGSGSATISKNAGATQGKMVDTINANILLNDNLTLYSGSSDVRGYLVINGVISGAGKSVTKTGNNLVRFIGAQAYSGDTIIDAGTLQLGSGVSGENGSVTGNIVNNASGMLSINNANTQTLSGGIYSGTGSFQKIGSGTLSLSGAWTLGGGGGSEFHVGSSSATSATTVDATAASSFTFSGTKFYVGAGPAGGGSMLGTLKLGILSSITANQVSIAGLDPDSNSDNGHAGLVTTLSNGTTTINTASMTIGAAKASGSISGQMGGVFSLGAGATLNLGTSNARTNLVLARNTVTNTAGAGIMNLAGVTSGTAGTAVANLYLNHLSLAHTTAGASLTGNMTLSDSVSNNLNVSGASGTGGVVQIGYNSSSGTTNGTLTIGNLGSSSAIASTDNGTAILIARKGSGTSTGTLTIKAGTLAINTSGAAVAGGGGTSTLNLFGGVKLVAGNHSSNWIHSLGTAALGAGGATIDTAGFNLSISQAFSGAGGLTKSGLGTLTLSGVSNYTGDTTVSSGSLVLAENAGLRFVISDGGANNKISGVGSATLEGRFTIDLSAVTGNTGSWQIVDTSTKSFTPTFAVNGWTESDNVWFFVNGGKTWSFSETTGVLTLNNGASTSDYDEWAASFNLLSGPDADEDSDGLNNLHEYAFGLDPTSAASNNPIKVPFDKATKKFRYTRRVNSTLTYTVEVSTTLQSWSNSAAVTQSVVAAANNVETVEVEFTAPLSGGSMFARVKAE